MEKLDQKAGWIIASCVIPCPDLRQITESEQCFRITPLVAGILTGHGDCGYRIISRGGVLRIQQRGLEPSFDCGEENMGFRLTYFDVDTDYQAVIDLVVPEDSYLAAAAVAGRGVRILHQDPWEMIITFVISQQKTIPKIRELVEALSAAYGKALEGGPGCGDMETVHVSPTPRELFRATLEELQALKLGYRTKYIHRLCQDAVSDALDLKGLAQMGYEEAMEYLTGLYGIGKKVVNCVHLFGLHHISAFPVDTWIEKVLMSQYYDQRKYRRIPKGRLLDCIITDRFGRYQGCAGVMQQHIFYYEHLRSSKLS